MRRALITPIWKGGDRRLPSEYRHVALTSHFSKLMERVLRKRMVKFLEASGHMDPNQHGSRSGRSTLSQLLIQYDLVLKMMEDGGNADVVYLDFSKAFDTVDFGLLRQKLAKIGFGGHLGRWI